MSGCGESSPGRAEKQRDKDVFSLSLIYSSPPQSQKISHGLCVCSEVEEGAITHAVGPRGVDKGQILKRWQSNNLASGAHFISYHLALFSPPFLFKVALSV